MQLLYKTMTSAYNAMHVIFNIRARDVIKFSQDSRMGQSARLPAPGSLLW